jgi:hypothetical protein
MIEELTQEQIDAMPSYVERFKRVGLCTDRMDKNAALAAVKKAYEIAGLELPENVIFTKGPKESNERIRADSNGEFNVLSGLYSGSLNAGIISYYAFFKEQCKLENMEDIDGLTDITHQCGWVNMFDTHVYISERPTVIRFDDRELLHCEDGPAIAYEDGFEIYSWHGQRVPGKWINEGLTAKDALTCENLEQRRAACEILGWPHILNELDAEVLHEDGDPEIGTLVAVEIPDIGREHFLRVQCGTGREFAIPVPPTCKTALEANAWTYGVEPYEYKPEVRT